MTRRIRLGVVLLKNRRFRIAVLLLLSALSVPLQAQQSPAAVTPLRLPIATPESVGLAPNLVEKMDAGMQDLVDKKQLAGIVMLVARHGKVVHHKAYGVQSLETNVP